MTSIRARHIFDGSHLCDGGTVIVEDGVISGIAAEPIDASDVLPDDAILSPGFIDLQVNGGGGVMWNDALGRDGLSCIAAAHARVGTTSIFPTLISGSRTAIGDALEAVRAAHDIPGIAGVHIEGPFLAPARRGIHPANAMLAFTDADVALLARDVGVPVLVTVAPDIVSPTHISALTRAGVLVFAGHSDATFAQVRAARAAGLSGFTHLYNAMSPLTTREPGVVGAALEDASACAGIIVDLHHVHAAVVRIAHAAMGPARLFLVSDAMATAASDLDHFTLYGVPIHLNGGRLTDAAGTLAGAHLTMADAVRNAVERVHIPLPDALRMATATPAAVGRLHDRGRIAPGLRADLVALDRDLCVIGVWQGGRPITPLSV